MEISEFAVSIISTSKKVVNLSNTENMNYF